MSIISMDKVNMTEATARFTFTAACGLSIFAAAAAMILRMRSLTLPALLFLLMAIAGCVLTLVAYKRYTMLRQVRWRNELKASEDELNQMLNHARMTELIEHVTGPLNDTAGEQPVSVQSPMKEQEVAQR